MAPKELEQRNRELSILHAVAKILNQKNSLKEVLDSTLKEVVELFNLGTGWIWLIEEENNKTYLASSYNLPPIFSENKKLLEGNCWCIKHYLENDLGSASNIDEIKCSRLTNLKKGTLGLKYHATVPLYIEGKKTGLLNVVSSKSQKLKDKELELLYTIGDMLSIAIQRSRLFEKNRKAGIIEERNRLAREIHDTVAQGLSAISLKAQTIELLLDSNSQEQDIKDNLQKIMELSQKNLEEVRRSVMDLRVSELLKNDIIDAIKKRLKEIKEKHAIDSSFKVSGVPIHIPIRIETAIFRIIQEATQNIILHSKADNIHILLIIEKGKIKLEIKDNGTGFDIDKLPKDRYGIIGMNERINLLNGIFEIKSEPDKGTVIVISIPLINE